MQISFAGLSSGCVLIPGRRELRHIDESERDISGKFSQGHPLSVENLTCKDLLIAVLWCHKVVRLWNPPTVYLFITDWTEPIKLKDKSHCWMVKDDAHHWELTDTNEMSSQVQSDLWTDLLIGNLVQNEIAHTDLNRDLFQSNTSGMNYNTACKLKPIYSQILHSIFFTCWGHSWGRFHTLSVKCAT